MDRELSTGFTLPEEPNPGAITADTFLGVPPELLEPPEPGFTYTEDQALQRGTALVMASPDDTGITPQQVSSELVTNAGNSPAEQQLIREMNAEQKSLLVGAGSDAALGGMDPAKLNVLRTLYKDVEFNTADNLHVRAGLQVSKDDPDPDRGSNLIEMLDRQMEEAEIRQNIVNSAIIETEPESWFGLTIDFVHAITPIINTVQFGHIANKLTKMEGYDAASKYALMGSAFDSIVAAYWAAPPEKRIEMFKVIVESIKEWNKIDAFGIASKVGVETKGGLGNFLVLEELLHRIESNDPNTLGAMDYIENTVGPLDVVGLLFAKLARTIRAGAQAIAPGSRGAKATRDAYAAQEQARSYLRSAIKAQAEKDAAKASKKKTKKGKKGSPLEHDGPIESDEYSGMGSQQEMDLPQGEPPAQGEFQFGEQPTPKGPRTFDSQGRTFVEGEAESGDQFMLPLEGGGRRPPPPPATGAAAPPRSTLPRGPAPPQMGLYLEGGRRGERLYKPSQGQGAQGALELDNPNAPSGGVQREFKFEPREPATPEQLALFPDPKWEQLAFDFGIKVPKPPKGTRPLVDQGIVPPLNEILIPARTRVTQGSHQNGAHFVGKGSPEVLGIVLAAGGKAVATGLGVAPSDVQSLLQPRLLGTLSAEAPPLVRDYLENALSRIGRITGRVNPRSYLTEAEQADRLTYMTDRAVSYSKSLGRIHLDKTDIEVNSTEQLIELTVRYGSDDGGYKTVEEALSAIVNAGGKVRYGTVDIVARNPVDGSFSKLTEDFIKHPVTRKSKGDFYIQSTQRHFWDADRIAGWGNKKLKRWDSVLTRWMTSRNLVLDRDITEYANVTDALQDGLNSRMMNIVKPYLRLSASKKENVNTAIREGDLKQVQWTEAELRTKFGLSTDERFAYWTVRAFYDTQYQIRNSLVYKYLNNRGARRIHIEGEDHLVLFEGYGHDIPKPPSGIKEVLDAETGLPISRKDADARVKGGSHQYVALDKRHHETLSRRKGDGWNYIIAPINKTRLDDLPEHVIPYYPGYAPRLYTDRFKVRQRASRKVDGVKEVFYEEKAMRPTERAAEELITTLRQDYLLQYGEEAPANMFSWKHTNELDQYAEPTPDSNGILDFFEVRGDRLPGEGIQEAPIEEIERALWRTSYSTSAFATHKEYIDAMRGRFVKQYSDLLAKESDGSVRYGAPVKATKQTVRGAEAQEVYDYIELYTSSAILRDDAVSRFQEEAANLVEHLVGSTGLSARSAAKSSKFIRDSNLMDIAGSINFSLWIALNMGGQLFQNSTTWFQLIALSPRVAFKSAWQATPALLGILTEGTPFYKHIRTASAKASGWSDADFDQIVRAMADSGLYNQFDLHQMFNSGILEIPGLNKAVRAAQGAVKIAKRAGFDVGEGINLGVSHVFSLQRIAEENGITIAHLAKRQDLLDKAAAEARDLTAAQNRLGAPPASRSGGRLAVQFTSTVLYNSIKLVRGSPYMHIGDRLRYIFGGLALTGVAILPKFVKDEVLQSDIEMTPNEQTIFEGAATDYFFNSVIKHVFLLMDHPKEEPDLAFASRISTFTGARVLENLAQAVFGFGDGRVDGIFQFLAGPSASSYSVFANAVKAIKTFTISEELDPYEKWELSSKQFMTLFPSGTAALRWEYAHRTGMLYNTYTGRETVPATLSRQLGLFLGIPSRKELNLRLASRVYYEYQGKGGKGDKAYLSDMLDEVFNKYRIYQTEFGPLMNEDGSINPKMMGLTQELIQAGASSMKYPAERAEFSKEVLSRLYKEGAKGGALEHIESLLNNNLTSGTIAERMFNILKKTSSVLVDEEFEQMIRRKWGEPIVEE